LGEHTEQVLAELDLTDAECEEIARRAGEGV